MKLGIIGLAQSGKRTVFEALTRNFIEPGPLLESQVGMVRVPDPRIDALSRMYEPEKTIYAQVAYLLPAKSHEKNADQNVWTQIRDCDALIHVVRNFTAYGMTPPTALQDFKKFDQEMIFSDLVVAEKRIERIDLDKKRGKKISDEELSLLEKCKSRLEAETPLRWDFEIAQAPSLRGFAFLSAKPVLILVNNADDDDTVPSEFGDNKEASMMIKAKLEQELGQMSEEEAKSFLEEFNITASAMDRAIESSYAILGRISFFTVGKDEVRAWTIRNGTAAVDAAEVIHSDIKKGFIRAEVVAYDDLMAAGSYAEARKKGTVRLEGKTYPVKDGDIINFRFNV
jgi:ribosome-binding ATPase